MDQLILYILRAAYLAGAAGYFVWTFCKLRPTREDLARFNVVSKILVWPTCALVAFVVGALWPVVALMKLWGGRR